MSVASSGTCVWCRKRILQWLAHESLLTVCFCDIVISVTVCFPRDAACAKPSFMNLAFLRVSLRKTRSGGVRDIPTVAEPLCREHSGKKLRLR
jgi:hypothetical protein